MNHHLKCLDLDWLNKISQKMSYLLQVTKREGMLPTSLKIYSIVTKRVKKTQHSCKHFRNWLPSVGLLIWSSYLVKIFATSILNGIGRQTIFHVTTSKASTNLSFTRSICNKEEITKLEEISTILQLTKMTSITSNTILWMIWAVE